MQDYRLSNSNLTGSKRSGAAIISASCVPNVPWIPITFFGVILVSETKGGPSCRTGSFAEVESKLVG